MKTTTSSSRRAMWAGFSAAMLLSRTVLWGALTPPDGGGMPTPNVTDNGSVTFFYADFMNPPPFGTRMEFVVDEGTEKAAYLVASVGSAALPYIARYAVSTPDLLAGSHTAYLRGLTGAGPTGYANSASMSFSITRGMSSMNTAPTVNAGADQTVTLPSTVARLGGSTSDDGLPSGHVTTTWSVVGPGSVVFADASSAATTATFTGLGQYLLRLTATDGALSSTDDVVVTVAPSPVGIAMVTPGAADSPASQNRNLCGTVTLIAKLTSPDPTATNLSSLVSGVRFFVLDGTRVVATLAATTAGSDVYTSAPFDTATVPDGATYKVMAQADLVNGGNPIPASSDLIGVSIFNAAPAVQISCQGRGQCTFTADFSGAGDVASVLFVTDGDTAYSQALTAVNVPGTAQYTASAALARGLHTIHSEMTNLSGAVLFRCSLTSFEVLEGPNKPPVVDAGPDQIFSLTNTAALNGVVTDDGLPWDDELKISWSVVSAPAEATPESIKIGDATVAATGVQASPAGHYVFRLTADDGQYTVSDDVEVNSPFSVVMVPPSPSGLCGVVPLTAKVISLVPAVTLTRVWIRIKNTETGQETGANAAAGPGANEYTALLDTTGLPSGKYTIWAEADGTLGGTAMGAFSSSVAATIDHEPLSMLILCERGSCSFSVNGLAAGATLNSLIIDYNTPNEAAVDPATLGAGPVLLSTGSHTVNALVTEAGMTHLYCTPIPFNNDGPNTPPVVNAGPDQIFSLTNIASLNGTVTDDGLPRDKTLTITWSVVSAPAEATPESIKIGDATVAATGVQASPAGHYVFRLTADDGQYTVSDDVEVNSPFSVVMIPPSPSGLCGVVPLTAKVISLVPAVTLTRVWIRIKNTENGQETGANAAAGPGANEYTALLDTTGLPSGKYAIWAEADGTLGGTAMGAFSSSVPASIDHEPQSLTIECERGRCTFGVNDLSAGAYLASVILDYKTPNETSVDAATLGAGPVYLSTGAHTANAVVNEGGEISFHCTPTPFNNDGPNTPPVVNAGPDQIFSLTNVAALNGVVTDDGLPREKELKISWSVVSAPAEATPESIKIGDAAVAATGVQASPGGHYVFRLTATDGEFTVSDDVAVDSPFSVVMIPPSPSGLCGVVPLTAKVIAVAPGTTLTRVWIRVKNKATGQETGADATAGPGANEYTATLDTAGLPSGKYTIWAEADGTLGGTALGAFSSSVAASIDHEPQSLTIACDRGRCTFGVNDLAAGAYLASVILDYNTPNETSVDAATLGAGPVYLPYGTHTVNAVVSEGGVSSFHCTPTPFNNDGPNTPPVVNAGPDQIFSLTNIASLNGTVTDDGLPRDKTLTITWSVVSAPAESTPASVNIFDAAVAATGVQASPAGHYVFRLTATDGEFTAFDDVEVNAAFSVVMVPPSPSGLCGVVPLTAKVISLVPATAVTQVRIWVTNTATNDKTGVLATAGPGANEYTATLDTTNLASGKYSLAAEADGKVGGTAVGVYSAPVAATVDHAPEDIVALCANGTCTITAKGLAADASSVSLILDYNTPKETSIAAANVPGTANWSAGPVVLPYGAHTVNTAVTAAGSSSFHCTPTRFNNDPANKAPVVNAGPDQTVTLPTLATVAGAVTDDGLPRVPGAVTLLWTKVSGPGAVTFADATAAGTAVTFSRAGNFVLRLTATDGALSASDDVAIVVKPVPAVNQPPVVNAGADFQAFLGTPFATLGAASDDGLPGAPAVFTKVWRMVSGPAPVTFADPNAPSTQVNVTAKGTYVLELTASDGALSASDQVSVTVVDAPPAPLIAPSVRSAPSSIAVKPGQNGMFNVVVAGTPPLTYQWKRNGAPIPGATTASYTTPATTDLDSGATFSCVIANAAGSVTTVNAVLTVATGSLDTTKPSAALVGPSSNQTVRGMATFSAKATDNVAIARVDFLLDGTLVTTVTKPDLGTTDVYSAAWDTKALGDGPHGMTVIATDTSGNETKSAPVLLMVNNVQAQTSVVNQSQATVSMTPNPAVKRNPMIRINVGAGAPPVEGAEVSLYDDNGALVKAFSMTGNQQELDASTLPSGVYTLVVVGKSGTETVRTKTKVAIVR